MAVVSGVKFGVVATFVQFDAKKWTIAQKAAIVKAMKEAAREWLQVILSRTPTDTGFLRAGFSNLAAAIGMSITSTGLKKGLDSYGKNLKLGNLENKYRALRDLALAKDWLEQKFKNVETSRLQKKKKRSTGEVYLKKVPVIKTLPAGYRRAIPKPLTGKQVKERLRRYKKRKAKQQKLTSAGPSDADRRQAGEILSEGLNIQKSLKSGGEKKSLALFRREQNQLYYAQQRERKAAQRLFRQLKTLRGKIGQATLSLNKALEKEPELKMKKRPKYYKWESVVIKKKVSVQKEVEVKNPAYNPRAVLEARKKKLPVPTPTIKQVQMVTEEREKVVRRRVKVGSEKDFVDIYRKYYYPRNGNKGPLKTPITGKSYGTAVDDIFLMESSSGRAQSVSEETSTVNKGGFEVGGKEQTLGSSFTPSSSLGSFKFTKEANLKITFNYGVDIRYWKIMDQYGRYTRNGKMITPKGAPWRAYVAANLAYMKILRTKLAANIVPFTSYMVKSNSKITPGFKGGL